MSHSAERIVYDLPQIEHLSDSRINRYLKRLTDLGLNTEWHCQRLAGFGGSEAGALLRHTYGVFFDAAGDSYKSAGEIIAEKLLAQLPRPATIQARRGTDIEALTQAVFRKKYKVRVCEEGFNASKKHKSHSCLLGNIDDSVFVGDKAILIDYKSSQKTYDEQPFDYVVRQHHYAAIAQSNGFNFSKGMIVGIHGPESVLQSLSKISSCRDGNPEAFDFWVDTLATRGIPGVELKVYPMSFDTNLIAVIENTLTHLWEQHVLAGKLLVSESNITLPEEQQSTVDRLMGESVRLMAMNNAINQKLAENNTQLQSMLTGVDHKKLPFIKKHPINISTRTELDTSAAIAALESQGVDIEAIKTTGTERDIRKLEAAFEALGGDLSLESLLEKKLPTKTIRAKLLEHNIDPGIYESISRKFSESKQKGKLAAFETEVAQWEGIIQEFALQTAIHSPAVSVDEDMAAESTMSM